MWVSHNCQILTYDHKLNKCKTFIIDDLYNKDNYHEVMIQSDKGWVQLEELLFTGLKLSVEASTINGHRITIPTDGYLIDAGFDPICANRMRVGSHVVIDSGKSNGSLCQSYGLDGIISIKKLGYIHTYSICIGGITHVSINDFLIPSMSIEVRDLYNIGMYQIIE